MWSILWTNWYEEIMGRCIQCSTIVQFECLNVSKIFQLCNITISQAGKYACGYSTYHFPIYIQSNYRIYFSGKIYCPTCLMYSCYFDNFRTKCHFQFGVVHFKNQFSRISFNKASSILYAMHFKIENNFQLYRLNSSSRTLCWVTWTYIEHILF